MGSITRGERSGSNNWARCRPFSCPHSSIDLYAQTHASTRKLSDGESLDNHITGAAENENLILMVPPYTPLHHENFLRTIGFQHIRLSRTKFLSMLNDDSL